MPTNKVSRKRGVRRQRGDEEIMRIRLYNSFSLKWLPRCLQVNVGSRPRIKEMAHAAPGQKNRTHKEDWLSERDPLSLAIPYATYQWSKGFKMLREKDQ